MRYSVRAILISFTVLAISMAAGRNAWLRWPDETLSFAIGLMAWICICALFYMCQTPEMPRNLRRVLLVILSGVVWMFAMRSSPSLVLLFVGFMASALGTLIVARFLPQLMTWCGIENS